MTDKEKTRKEEEEVKDVWAGKEEGEAGRRASHLRDVSSVLSPTLLRSIRRFIDCLPPLPIEGGRL